MAGPGTARNRLCQPPKPAFALSGIGDQARSTQGGHECDTPFDASHFGATKRLPIAHCFFGLSIADQVKLSQQLVLQAGRRLIRPPERSSS